MVLNDFDMKTCLPYVMWIVESITIFGMYEFAIYRVGSFDGKVFPAKHTPSYHNVCSTLVNRFGPTVQNKNIFYI